MKNRLLNLTILLVGLFAPLIGFAGDFPASNFQPKVIFISEEAVSQSSAQVTASTSPCESKTEQTVFDPKYPAASFQPKVIFSSADAR